MHFEKIAVSLKWPEQIWTVLLQSVLIGKAREIYSALPVDKYTVGKSILKGYELAPEVYKQKFRSTSKGNKKTFIEFAQDKKCLFDRWCTSHNVDGDFARLWHINGGIQNCLSIKVKTYIGDEHKG